MPDEVVEKKGKSKSAGAREITFRCRSCDQHKKLTDMAVITRFFPPLVVCRDCEKAMR